MLENEKITIVTDDGEETATILFTVNHNNKDYVIFEFDVSEEVSAAIYVESETNEGQLIDIETEKEWDFIEKVYEQYLDDLEDEELESDD